MAKNGSRKKASRSPEFLRKLRKLGMRWLVRAAVAALLLLALVVGARKAWASLTGGPEFKLSAATISLPDCHPIVQAPAMAAELRRQVGPVLQGASIFEPGLCGRVEQQLRANPWVLQVRSVRRQLPNQLQIDLVFRVPAGLVQYSGRTYMVDANGWYLPDGPGDGLYRRPPAWQLSDAPVIVCSSLRGLPPRGRPWINASDRGDALAVGARLYSFLERNGLFQELAVRTIDVSRVGAKPGAANEPEIVLTTRDGVQVKWGRSDAYTLVAGLQDLKPLYSDERKLAMLRTKLAEYPELQGLRYIDLRFDRIFYRPVQAALP